MKESSAVRRLVNGYQVSQAVHVAVVLGLSDLLARGPRSVEDLADEADCHPRSLFRLLRALSTVGVYEELADGRFKSSALGDFLRSDAAEPIAGWAAFIGRPYHWQAWSGLLHSVRTGENAFSSINGQSVWEYRAAHPDEGVVFDDAMTSLSKLMAGSVLDAYDFGRFASVVDVGGGHGAFLAAIMNRNPAQRGVLFDQPHVVAGATELLRKAGVESRCQVVGGDFFDTVPPDGHAYILKGVLHDWEDTEVRTILRTCRRAMTDNAILLIVERLLAGPNQGPEAAFSDLNMLVNTGGLGRTEAGYRDLLTRTGFRPTTTVLAAGEIGIVEAVAA